MHHTNLWSTNIVFYLTEGLHCTCIFRTCVFHPCGFVLAFSVLAFSILAKCAVSYLPFPYLRFPVLAFSAPPCMMPNSTGASERFRKWGIHICTNPINLVVKVVCLKFWNKPYLWLGGTRGTSPELGRYNVPPCPHSSDASVPKHAVNTKSVFVFYVVQL